MNAAETHLEEMNDLAGRILAMENTLAHYETGKRPITIWDLGRELAELVVHYNPNEDEYPQDSGKQMTLDTLADRGVASREEIAERIADYENERGCDLWMDFFGPLFDDIEKAIFDRT